MTIRSAVFLAVLLWITGCPQGGGAVWGQRPVKYPATWPIPELTLPDGAVQIKLHDFDGPANAVWETDGKVEAAGYQQERKTWRIAFKYSGTPADLQDHIDSCLKPLGYQLMWNGQLPGQRRGYITPDRRRQVQIEYLDLDPIPLAQQPGWQGYRLGIAFWANSRPDIASTEPIP